MVSSTDPLSAVLSSSAAVGAVAVASRAGGSGRSAAAGAACALNRADPAPAATATPSTAVMLRLAFRAGERGVMVGFSFPARGSLRPLANGDKNKHVPPTCAGLWHSPTPWFSAQKPSYFHLAAPEYCFFPCLPSAAAPVLRPVRRSPMRPLRRAHPHPQLPMILSVTAARACSSCT